MQGFDPTLNGLITPGPKNETAPQGNVEREAIDALRGYAYQIAVTALAWLELSPAERLYIEVAEDYAICADDAVKAVQVKDTEQSGKITLNSTNVKETLKNFIDLVEKNPGQKVTLHFLTTSEVGIERSKINRPAGEAGLLHWRKVAASGDVVHLRRILTADEMPKEVKTFVDARDDETLRGELLKRIHWDCGKPNFSQILVELEQSIAQVGRQRFGMAGTASKYAASMVMYRILQKATLKTREERVLLRADLDTLLDAASRVSLRQRDFDVIMGRLAAAPLAAIGGENGTVIDVGGYPPWIYLDQDIRGPVLALERHLQDGICSALLTSPYVVLSGATGLGKTLLARKAIQHLRKTYALIDFRDLEPASLQQRLDVLVSYLHNLRVDAVIFDDLNHLEDGSVRKSFNRVLSALQRRDQLAIITCYRKPSVSIATDLNIASSNFFDVPYFAENEISDLVKLAGGDPAKWAKISMFASGNGHPQLAGAFIQGVSSRNWPQDELRKITQTGFTSADTVALRDEARQRLIEGLEKDSQLLLWRTSLIIGSFVRDLAIALGDVTPRLAQAGVTLDRLTGSWVEPLASDRFRVSPLLARAGDKILGENERGAVHSAIARHLVKDKGVSVVDADTVLVHGLAGKDSSVLMAIATATISAPQSILTSIADYSFAFPNLKLDAVIFPEHLGLSALLRLAQCKVVLAKGVIEEIEKVTSTLLREIDSLTGKMRSGVESVSLINLLSITGGAGRIPNWLELINRFRRLLISDKELAKRMEGGEKFPGSEHLSTLGCFLITGLSRMPSVKSLEEFFLKLDRLSANDRGQLLSEFHQDNSDYDLIVSGAWLTEHEAGAVDWLNNEKYYLRMAEMAMAWGQPILAAYCHKARAVMIDEYGNQPILALTALDEAALKLDGSDIIIRERIKVFWRMKNYSQVVELITPVVDVVVLSNSTDRMFVLREAAISAANIGRTKLAAKWFHGAAQAVKDTPENQPRIIGFSVDEAMAEFDAGNRSRCIELLAQAMTNLSKLESDQSTEAMYCKHLVRHAVLCVQLRSEASLPRNLFNEILWLPGSGSNPQPPKELRERPLAPLDMAWYLLAEAEIMSSADVGVFRNLRARLQSGPVQLQEMTIRKKPIDAAIIYKDGNRFAGSFHSYLESLSLFFSLSEEYKQTFDVMNPTRGEVPTVPIKQLIGNERVNLSAVEAILAFSMSVALTGEFDKIDELERGLQSKVGLDFPGSKIFQRFRGEGAELNRLSEEITTIIKKMRPESHLVPFDICGVALRFSEFAHGSNFKRDLIPILGSWFIDHWRNILINESFRLKSPMLHKPQIEEVINNQDMDIEQKLALLLLAGCDATELRLADEYRRILQQRSLSSARSDGRKVEA